MDFREVYERYIDGKATEAEKQLVDDEIEKYELIETHINDKFDNMGDIPELEDNTGESKRINHRVWLRITALLLAVFIVTYVVTYGLMFWLPEVTSYNPDEGGMLSKDLQVYSELHSSEYDIDATVYPIGRGKYRIDAWAVHTFTDEVIRYQSEFNGQTLFGRRPTYGQAFITAAAYSENMTEYDDSCFREQEDINAEIRAFIHPQSDAANQQVMNEIDILPEYTTVQASVLFKDTISTQQMLDMEANFGGEIFVNYCGVRNGYSTGLMGFRRNELNDGEERNNAAKLDQHYKSMLKYMSERSEFLEKIPNSDWKPEDYEAILEYTEQNGVSISAAVIVASPEGIKELCMHENIYKIVVCDVDMKPSYLKEYRSVFQ